MTKIDLCSKIIGFEIISTLLNFQDKYYEHGMEGLETKGLSFGGYEQVLLVPSVERNLQRLHIFGVEG